MSQAEAIRREPNLKRYTEAEIDEMLDKFAELTLSGKKKEAEEILALIPLLPQGAKILKEEVGIDAMIEYGCNLSEAVEAYGYEWLEKS